jgi:hypothetical protein
MSRWFRILAAVALVIGAPAMPAAAGQKPSGSEHKSSGDAPRASDTARQKCPSCEEEEKTQRPIDRKAAH